MEMHLICLDILVHFSRLSKGCCLPLEEYRAGIVFSNAWHCLRTNLNIYGQKINSTSIKSTPKSLLSFRYFIGAMFILMPKKLIFMLIRSSIYYRGKNLLSVKITITNIKNMAI